MVYFFTPYSVCTSYIFYQATLELGTKSSNGENNWIYMDRQTADCGLQTRAKMKTADYSF